MLRISLLRGRKAFISQPSIMSLFLSAWYTHRYDSWTIVQQMSYVCPLYAVALFILLPLRALCPPLYEWTQKGRQ